MSDGRPDLSAAAAVRGPHRIARAARDRLRSVRTRVAEFRGEASRKRGTSRAGARPAIRDAAPGAGANEVEAYWGKHTVNTLRSWTPEASERQLEDRFRQYPLFRELSGLWGEHDGEVVLDYGCGPGNDLVGFALRTGATSIIGIDVSTTALELAADRLSIHGIGPERVELVHAEEGAHEIPLLDGSVDFFQSQGVLHHVTDPVALLRELRRVLRPGGTGTVMVYNRESLWFHLYVAYAQMIRGSAFEGLSVEEAFACTTDGEDCPIARCYRGEDFVSLCRAAGFEATFLGGYHSRLELETLDELRSEAIADDRLGDEHRDFLRSLELDGSGYPLHGGLHAGIGGTYTLRRPAATARDSD